MTAALAPARGCCAQRGTPLPPGRGPQGPQDPQGGLFTRESAGPGGPGGVPPPPCLRPSWPRAHSSLGAVRCEGVGRTCRCCGRRRPCPPRRTHRPGSRTAGAARRGASAASSGLSERRWAPPSWWYGSCGLACRLRARGPGPGQRPPRARGSPRAHRRTAVHGSGASRAAGAISAAAATASLPRLGHRPRTVAGLLPCGYPADVTAWLFDAGWRPATRSGMMTTLISRTCSAPQALSGRTCVRRVDLHHSRPLSPGTSRQAAEKIGRAWPAHLELPLPAPTDCRRPWRCWLDVRGAASGSRRVPGSVDVGVAVCLCRRRQAPLAVEVVMQIT